VSLWSLLLIFPDRVSFRFSAHVCNITFSALTALIIVKMSNDYPSHSEFYALFNHTLLLLKPCSHLTPKAFEIGGFTLKTHQMFSATITGHFRFVLAETRSGKSIDSQILMLIFTKSCCFQNKRIVKILRITLHN